MANEFSGNVAYIDSTGDSAIGTGKGNIKLIGVLFTPNASGDQIDIRDSSGGRRKFLAKGAVADSTMFFDLASTPIIFTGAVHIQTLTSSATAILIVKFGSA